LVDEVLQSTAQATEGVLAEFRRMHRKRARWREELQQRGLVQHESALGYPGLPTTCAADDLRCRRPALPTDRTSLTGS
jgi:hypothetical protein